VAPAIAEEFLRKPLREVVGKDVALSARQKVYLAGGIVWVAATCQRPDMDEDYIPLSGGDIDNFVNRVRENPRFLETIGPSGTLDSRQSERFSKEVVKMRSAFKDPDRLSAGAEILSALVSELKLSQKELWYYRHSDTDWSVSYVTEKRQRN
jgi:hypothetical protein